MTAIKRNNIEEYIYNLEPYDICTIWNAYCERSNHMDNQIYPMNMLGDLFADASAKQLLEKLSSDFNFNALVFYFASDGSLCSEDDLTSIAPPHIIIDYIIEYDDDLNNQYIRDCLDYISKEEIVEWLYEHKQVWADFTRRFNLPWDYDDAEFVERGLRGATSDN